MSTDGDPHARCGVVRQAQFLVEVTNISVVGDIIIVLHRSAVIRRPAITLIVRIRSDRGQGQIIGHVIVGTQRGIIHSVVTERFRSEEHTSELQSLMRISYAVFCLNKKTTTLRKKNTKNKI